MLEIIKTLNDRRNNLMTAYSNALGKAYEIEDNLKLAANYLEHSVDRLVEIDDYLVRFMGDAAPGGWIPGADDPILSGHYLGFNDQEKICEVAYFDMGDGWKSSFGTPDFWRELPAIPAKL